MKGKSSIFRDPEFWFIIVFNAVLIGLYLTNNYDARFIIWGYYLQSVFIGIEYVGLSFIQKTKRDRSIFPLKKFAFTFFFILHFGLFHLVYFVFLTGMSLKGEIEHYLSLYSFIRITLGTLVMNLAFVFGREVIPTTQSYPKPSVIAAYTRIIPIHLFIIFSPVNTGMGGGAFLLFMALKVVFDLAAYMLFHFIGGGAINVDNSRS